MDLALRDRIAGSLYCLLVGDALGAPLAGLSPARVREVYGSRLTMSPGRGQRAWPRGLHGAGGQQALALLDALVEQRRADELEERFARVLVDLYEADESGGERPGLFRAADDALLGTLDRLARAGGPAAAGPPGDVGVAVRAAPLGLALRDDGDDALLDAVAASARVTGGDAEAAAAAAAVAWVVRAGLFHEGPAAGLDGDALVTFVRRAEGEGAGGRRSFADVLASALAEKKRPLDEQIATAEGQGSEAARMVPLAVVLHLTSGTLEDALQRALWLGGDAGARGALVGQMAGALYGRSAIPRRWVDPLLARGTLSDRVLALAEGRPAFTPAFTLEELERSWTGLLDEVQGTRAAPRPSPPPRPPEGLDVEDDPFEGSSGEFSGSVNETMKISLSQVRDEVEAELQGGGAFSGSDRETVRLDPEAVARALGKGEGQLSFFADKPPLTVERGDITEQEVDAIVNAANTSLLGGSGVDGAIHRRGGPTILAECQAIRSAQGGCKTGEAVVTTAGALAAQWVIHTVGPRWKDGEQGEDELLASAYARSLERAAEKGARTVAFPSISTGAYGFPLERAARIAVEALLGGLRAHDGAFDEVRVVAFDEKTRAAFEEALRACLR